MTSHVQAAGRRSGRLAAVLVVGAALALLPAPVPAAVADRNAPTVTSLRLRMGVIGQVFIYPPTVPMTEGAHAVLFFSGDWGWRPVQQETASWLANHGRYVVGIDSTEYFSRKLEPSDWARDLKTLRTFANEKAGLPADAPVLLVGFTWGAELVPYMLNRGGAQGFAGALLIGPDEDSACVYRVTLQMKSRPIPSPADEQFRVPDELRRMAPIPTVFMQGEQDVESRAAALVDLVRGPHKLVSIPGADKQFRDVRDVYFSMVGQALSWIEGPHPPAGETTAPRPQPATPPAAGPGTAPPRAPSR
jgi:hypothetical protein